MTKQTEHLRMDLAMLKLKGRFSFEELGAALGELFDKGYIAVCDDERHGRHCWRLVKVSA